MLYSLLRKLLFLFPAESSHELGLQGLSWLHRLGLGTLLSGAVPEHPVRVLGLDFRNPVGLAAGLDKNADYLDALGALGFGFVEVGTVTPRPQDGNPRPRLFRLPRELAIINRMGFNNKGLDHMIRRLRERRYGGIVGVNIGKNLDTPVEKAVEDYLQCLRGVYPLADYVVVNLSSPNTPGLRSLQFGKPLEVLLRRLKEEQAQLEAQHARKVPLLLKVAPDLTDDEIVGISGVLLSTGMEGVIVSNTTISRVGLEAAEHGSEAGGLSGAPLGRMSTQVLAKFVEALNGALAVIGAGGIMQAADAVAKRRAGADLVQLYSGFVYTGPGLIAESIKAFEREREHAPA